MTVDVERLYALVSSAGRPVGLKELARAGAMSPGAQQALKRALRALVKEGRLAQVGKRFLVPEREYSKRSGPAWSGPPKRGRAPSSARPSRSDRSEGPARAPFAPQAPRGPGAPSPRHKADAKRGTIIDGVIHHHRDGFAFVKPLVGKAADIFVPVDQARRALDHDRVKIEVVPGRDGRTMGRVVEIVQRTRQQVIGEYQEERGVAFVLPRESELGPIAVPATQLARPGDLVKVRLGVGDSVLSGRGGLHGEVAGSLGAQSDHSVEVLSVAYAKGFHDEFPPDVMDEADEIHLEVSDDEARGAGRRDLRSLPLVTIDGEDARDFDDAIFVEDRPEGWRLVVAIADVSHYVREGTALDAEALRRATSVYLPGRVLPMLPERLSNGICSLKPDVDRLCMVADMVIDRGGVTTNSQVYPGVMRSAARCTYTEVHQVLAGELVPGRTELAPLFRRAHALAQCLTTMRLKRGAIDFDLPETRVELGEDGLPARLVRRERWESHRLVEECMLAANEAVARFCQAQGLPTVNRFHGEPDPDKLAVFTSLLGAYGVPVKAGPLSSAELNQVLAKLVGHAEQRALHQLALRSMMQAIYSVQERGHYGLGASDYLHFTSPIRRYPDLLVHRLLKRFWAQGAQPAASAAGRRGKHHRKDARAVEALEAMAQQSSERERAAMQVEREVNALYSCLLMKDRVGEEFPATVAGLSEAGFYVELEDLFVEGLVRGESVFPRFAFDMAKHRLTFGDGRVVKVGQKVRVLLEHVNLKRKQLDFVAVSFDGEAAARVPRRLPARGEPSVETSDRRGPRPAGRERGGKPWVRRDAPRGASRSTGREDRRQPTRAPQAEAQPSRPPRAASEAPTGNGFDARAVLDRLWQAKGGKGKAPAPAEKPGKRGGPRRGKR